MNSRIIVISFVQFLLVACGSSSGSDQSNSSSVVSSANPVSSSSSSVESSLPVSSSSASDSSSSANVSNSSEMSSSSSIDAGNSSSAATSSSSTSSAVSSTGNNSSVLVGTWFRDCAEENPGEEDTLYDTVELQIDQLKMNSDIRVYEDASCTIPFAHAPNPTASGTYIIGTTFTSDDGLEVTELDTHLTEINGAEFDIHEYTIFYIDGERLYFGIDTEDTTHRVTNLDLIRVFYKQ